MYISIYDFVCLCFRVAMCTCVLSLCVEWQCLWFRVSVLLCVQLCLCHSELYISLSVYSILYISVYDFVTATHCNTRLWYTMYQCLRLWFCVCQCVSEKMSRYLLTYPLHKCVSGRNRSRYQNETCCVYDRFQSKFHIPDSEIQQIQKLKFHGTNSNQTKISIWILYHKIPRNLSHSLSIPRISGMWHFQWNLSLMIYEWQCLWMHQYVCSCV